MYKSVRFLSQSKMSSAPSCNNTIAISITSPSVNSLDLGGKFHDVLYLKFDNIERLHDNYVRFSFAQADEVYKFLKKYEGQVDNVLVNCQQGESRSAGLAKSIAQEYNLPLKQDTSNMVRVVYEIMSMKFEQEG